MRREIEQDRENAARELAGLGRPADGETRKRVKLAPIRTLMPFVLNYRGRLIAAFCALVVASAATLMVPLAVRRMIDHGFAGADGGLIDLYFMTMIAVVGVLAVASATRYYLVTWLGERVVSDLRAAVFAHLTRLSPAFFDRAQSGEVVSRLTADTTQIKSAVGSSASQALRNLFLFLGASAMMVVTSPRLSTMVLLAIPFIVLPMVAFGRKVRRKSRHAQDTLADAAAYAAEAIGAIRAVQAFTQENAATARFGAAVENAFAAARASTFARAVLTAFGLFMVFASVVGVLWIGAQDVLSGRLTPGALSQFVLYAVFAAGALGELSTVWGEVALAAGAAERLSELLDEEPDITAPKKPVSLPDRIVGRIAFDRVRFAYPGDAKRPVLEDLSLNVVPGETVAIVGPSGAGKSTLFQLLLRFYDPQSGSIALDGTAIDEADPHAVRRQIALVPQDPVIFAASARDNIAFGRPGATSEEIEAAAVAANADGFIREMARGYDTDIGERGVTLSGGQKQRIAIARAILRDAPLLLLDEATSALDAQSEALVQDALGHLMKGRTTLVIAHRLATVQRADRILVMDRGQIVESGTHGELVAEGGLYAELARLQFAANAAVADLRAAE